MKIAIYYPWVYLTSGVERVILEIVKRGKHDYTIFTNHFDKENTYPEFKNFRVMELKRIAVERDISSVAKAAITLANQKINLSAFDAVLVHSEGMGDLFLVRNHKIPVVCFCHTPLRPVFDRFYRRLALLNRSGFERFKFLFFSYLFKKVDQILWRGYSYVFFNSRETLGRAKRGGLVSPVRRRVEVLNPGVDWQRCNPTWVYRPFFLVPGRIMWAKNVKLGIRAFIKFKNSSQKFATFRLVIAGQVDRKSKIYLKELKEMVKDREDIIFVVSPSERKLRSLYASCRAVLAPSFNEDFGLTLLEGNAWGKPTIAINRGGPKENQINGKTGYLVSEDEGEIAKKMILFANNVSLAKKMGKFARENSKKYGWKKFVERIEATIEKVAT